MMKIDSNFWKKKGYNKTVEQIFIQGVQNVYAWGRLSQEVFAGGRAR